MLTPLEIAGKHFNKAMSGYNRTEVAMYLKEVSNEVEVLLEKNEHLHKQLKSMENELDKFNRIEKNINDALVVAQSTAHQVVHSANEKADMIIKEAEYKAQKIVDESKDYALTLRRNSEDLRKEYEMFKSRLRSMLQSEIDALDKTYPAAPEIKTPAMIQELAAKAQQAEPVQTAAPAEVVAQEPVEVAPVAHVEPVVVPVVAPAVSHKEPETTEVDQNTVIAASPLQAVPGNHPLHVRPASAPTATAVPTVAPTATPTAAPAGTAAPEKLGKLQQEIQRLENEAAKGNLAMLDQVLDNASRNHR